MTAVQVGDEIRMLWRSDRGFGCTGRKPREERRERRGWGWAVGSLYLVTMRRRKGLRECWRYQVRRRVGREMVAGLEDCGFCSGPITRRSEVVVLMMHDQARRELLE